MSRFNRDFGATQTAGELENLSVIPSLVNRGYIMDLTAERSFLRFLASPGNAALLVDWGTPGETELAQTLDDYVDCQFRNALSVAVETAAGNPCLLTVIAWVLLLAAKHPRGPREPEKMRGARAARFTLGFSCWNRGAAGGDLNGTYCLSSVSVSGC